MNPAGAMIESDRPEFDSRVTAADPVHGAGVAAAPVDRDRPGLRVSRVVAAALLGLSFLLADLPPLHHSDVWGHLKIGEWILAHGRLPAREPLCVFSDHDSEYIKFYWLGQVAMALVFHAGEALAGGDATRRIGGGVEALRAGVALLVLLRFGALLVALRRAGGSLPAACLGLAVALAASTGHITVARPQVASELELACLLVVSSRPVPSRLAPGGVPALMAVWANVHGSVVVGLALRSSWVVRPSRQSARIRRGAGSPSSVNGGDDSCGCSSCRPGPSPC